MLFKNTIKFKEGEVKVVLGPWYEKAREECFKEGKSEEFARFVCRILANAIRRDDFYKYCPLAAKTLRQQYGRDINKEILSSGLVDFKPHNQRNKLARGFRPSVKLLNMLQLHETLKLKRKQRNRKSKFNYTIGNTNSQYPALVTRAIPCISQNSFHLNLTGAWEYIRLLNDLRKRKKEHERRIMERYAGDVASLSTLYNDKSTLLYKQNGKDILMTYGKYKAQKGGRLQEIYGGFQNCSRTLKYCLLYDMGYINYDLKKSQLYCLKKLWVDYNLPTEKIDEFLAKLEQNIEKVGMQEGDFKDAMYAFVMGAPLGQRGSINSIINTADKLYSLKETFTVFSEVMQPLNYYNQVLLDEIVANPLKKHRKRYNGKITLMNDCEMPFLDYKIDRLGNVLIKEVNEFRKPNKKELSKFRRELMSFMLTGIEASFIHHLTKLCTDDGIPVVANEHDGIITTQEIPTNLLDQARELSNFPYANLVEKPICKEEELNDWGIVVS